MKKIILTISVFIAVALLATAGIYFYQNYDSGEQIIVVEASEDPQGTIEMYVKLTDEQVKTIKKRVEKNMTRIADGGAPLNEVEAREIFNYITAVAVERLNIEIEYIKVATGVREYFGARAVCAPRYDEERCISVLPILVDREAYDNAKTSADSLISLLFVLTHEIGHGLEPEYAHKPESLMGLVVNLYYDACSAVPEYAGEKRTTNVKEMAADIFACSVMLDEFKFILEKVQLSLVNSNYEWFYGDLLSNQRENLLISVLPGMYEVYETFPLNETTMLPAVTKAYEGGEIEPNTALSALFDRGGSFGVPTFAEFVKYADGAFGVGKIDSLFKDKEINGISTDALKRYVLCAPFILGIEDVPYESYGKYLAGLREQHDDVAKLLDIDRLWVPEWAAEIDNGEFARIIAPYLQ